MNIISKLFNKINKQVDIKINMNVDNNFNEEEYNRYNNKKIEEFKRKYDLSTIDGITAIPIEEAKKYPDGGQSVVYMPEQILSRQATEYKKGGQYDLAIACLKKANELYPYSFYYYTRDNYERLVDFMVLAKQFSQAKEEHAKLDKKYGTRLQELQSLQESVVKSGDESWESYQNRIIEPYIKESRDREQYYWLLENFPELAPKSFGGYRKMKTNNSNNYQKIVFEVKKHGFDLENIKFWK